MRSVRHATLTCAAITLGLYASPVFAGAQAEFDVTLSPAGSFVGKSNKVTGNAYKTANGVAAENVAIDLTGLTTGVGLRDKHTKEHLDIAKYPQAKLIKAVGHDGKGEALVEIHGVRQKVSGTYKIEGNTLKAQFPIELSKVNISNIRYMGIGVKDMVTVKIDLPLGDRPAGRATASAPKK